MSSATIRDELNSVNLNRTDELLGNLSFGEILTWLLEKATPTETGVVPSSNVITLANQPVAVFQVNATAGTVPGIKRLRKGVVGTLVPAAGECVWQPGTKKIAFAASDGVTAVSITYSQLTDYCSLTAPTLDSLDGG